MRFASGQRGSAMKKYFGLYRGITSVDRSPIGYGEMEVLINEQGISHRIATGERIVTDAVPLSQARLLTTREVGNHFRPGMNMLGGEGIKIGHAGIDMLFKIAIFGDRSPRALLCGMPFEAEFGKTMLYTPPQVNDGLFTQYLWAVELQYWPGCVPMLEHGGRPLRATPPK